MSRLTYGVPSVYTWGTGRVLARYWQGYGRGTEGVRKGYVRGHSRARLSIARYFLFSRNNGEAFGSTRAGYLAGYSGVLLGYSWGTLGVL